MATTTVLMGTMTTTTEITTAGTVDRISSPSASTPKPVFDGRLLVGAAHAENLYTHSVWHALSPGPTCR